MILFVTDAVDIELSDNVVARGRLIRQETPLLPVPAWSRLIAGCHRRGGAVDHADAEVEASGSVGLRDVDGRDEVLQVVDVRADREFCEPNDVSRPS